MTVPASAHGEQRRRFCEGQFAAKYIPTIGIDYGVKKVATTSRDIRLNFFDMAGQQEYEAVRAEFYADAQGGLLVFNPAERASFAALSLWMAEAQACGAHAMV